MTPDRALDELKAGNERFVSGKTRLRDFPREVRSTSSGQHPFAAVLGCIDSRVTPEFVFDTGVGDIFVGRIAGNYVSRDMLGSLEFATQVAGAKVILILGHTNCGAVRAACDEVSLGNFTHTLGSLAPALAVASEIEGPSNSTNEAYVQAVTHANIKLNARAMTERSKIIHEMVASGKLKISGGLYDLSTGRVTFLEVTQGAPNSESTLSSDSKAEVS